jgi:1-acyl-sn-glycerol-3-phosphate acyltransferase
MPERSHRSAELVAALGSPPLRWAARSLFDLDVSGAENVPSGGVVVAANHLSHIDPPLITMSVGRNLRYIALDGLFGNGAVFDAVTLFFGAIPTSREGAPLGPLKEAIAHVSAGGAVGLFPEGRRVAYWGESDPKRGAAWLAWMTGAPLLPVTIGGSERTLSATHEGLRRPSLRVWIDQPLWWYDFADHVDPVGAMTERWRAVLDGHLAVWWAR